MYTRCIFFRFRPEPTTIVDNENENDDADDCLTNYAILDLVIKTDNTHTYRHTLKSFK